MYFSSYSLSRMQLFSFKTSPNSFADCLPLISLLANNNSNTNEDITMRYFLLLVSLAALVHSLNYSLALSLDNPDRLTRVFYDSDELRAVLYGPSTKKGLAFRSYDWEPDSTSRWLPFNYLPSVVQYYSKA